MGWCASGTKLEFTKLYNTKLEYTKLYNTILEYIGDILYWNILKWTNLEYTKLYNTKSSTTRFIEPSCGRTHKVNPKPIGFGLASQWPHNVWSLPGVSGIY
uniref:Uncharacterized protein n=1 Tax=Capsaspora owczarzaki TaxID=192875 RepID=M1K4Q9_9EUKA|nr:hypothetical protein [Capsaspora owczarzaki]